MKLNRRSLFRAATLAGGAGVLATAGQPLAHATPTEPGNAPRTGRAMLSEEGIGEKESAGLPNGRKYLSVSFPNDSGQAAGPRRPQNSATLRVSFHSGRKEILTAHPSSHGPDNPGRRVTSELITIPEDATAVEFLAVQGGGTARVATAEPSLHVRRAEPVLPAGVVPYAAGPGNGPAGSAVPPEAVGPAIGSAVLGSSALVLGSSLAAGAPLPGLPTPGPQAGNGTGPLAELGIITREQWGADESLRTWGASGTRAQCITIHHSATAVGPDYAQDIRGFYRFHASSYNGGQGWGDIGYHLLVDPDGRIYQGRHTGVPGQAVFTNSTGTLNSVTAGHVGGANNGNIGICMIGNFQNQPPTDAAIRATTRAVSVLCRLIRLDPRANVYYSNGSRGAWKPAVSGHRDWADFSGSTACPGDMAYPLLPRIRANA